VRNDRIGSGGGFCDTVIGYYGRLQINSKPTRINFGKHCFGLDINFGAKLIRWFSVTLEYAPGMPRQNILQCELPIPPIPVYVHSDRIGSDGGFCTGIG
jgi:hypothetical protein